MRIFRRKNMYKEAMFIIYVKDQEKSKKFYE